MQTQGRAIQSEATVWIISWAPLLPNLNRCSKHYNTNQDRRGSKEKYHQDLYRHQWLCRITHSNSVRNG